MAIYKFRITFEDFDDVIREIDIKSNQTFEDLHKAIHKSTGYKVDKPSSFYVSTDNWLKGDEIAFLPSERKKDRVVLMENSKLSGFIEDPHQKFYYIYNFDRPYDFHVELVKIILDADPNIDYPFLSRSVGEAPKIISQNSPNAVDPLGSTENANEFDFLNELNFIPGDTDELDAMGEMGINEEERDENDEAVEGDEFGDEFSEGDNFEEDSHKDDY
ncbi:plasmid pRiA4b ORF-3 family protein [Pedobacter mucosus]|uniref:plasmid pRiA4b ORF-3 family protein n=1 Tax=Pedobacter mucosus TaxID=2895286 RepID=UPI001EE49C48|nr:plasmid pRiA4b ORF-3 family protein [Pedobacter mucosus]UKT62358.1 plasmid pRiA4b ORF-3 family protein [Pedobacter mucosus]